MPHPSPPPHTPPAHPRPPRARSGFELSSAAQPSRCPLSERVQGTLSLHPRGFGFLDLGGDESAFVAPPQLRGFLAGDRVSAAVRADERGPAASELELVERWRTVLWGRIGRRRGKLVLECDSSVSNSDWPLLGSPSDAAAEGSACLAELEGDSARFLRALEPERAVLERTLARWGIEEGFAPEVLAAAEVSPTLDPAGRRDLREIPTITIDAPSSRDLDDALAVLPPQEGGALRVLVSIADVDAAVPAGSALDLAARARGTTVYLPDLVLPMIPRALSEDRLSLLPGVERAAVTLELRIDTDGVVTATDPYLSLIRSHARLSYEGAAAFLDQGDAREVPSEVQGTLRWLRTAAARLGAARKARGGLEIQRGEVKLCCEGENQPTEVVPIVETSAHRLVERLMVAANEALAAWLKARGLPGLYRVQDEPEPERVERLVEYARNFGFETAFGARLTPRGLSAFEEQFQSSSAAPQVRTVLRRVLGRARYQTAHAPHYGLGSPGYLHFTSPIRRYADLSVHRVVKAHLLGQREAASSDPAQDALAAHLNERASRASRAETERLRQLLARLFADRLGERFAGRVVAVKAHGLVLQLDGLGASGLLPKGALPDGPYELEREHEQLKSPTRTFSIGQALEVALAATDEDEGGLELSLLE